MNATEIAAQFVKAAAHSSGLTQQEIIGKGRRRAVVRVRWSVWLALREMGMPFIEIGYLFNCDRKAIIHACEECVKFTGYERLVFDEAKAAAKATLSNQTKP